MADPSTDDNILQECRSLIARGIDPNTKFGDLEFTPLHYVVNQIYDKAPIYLECTQFLLEHGADPNSQTKYLSTPLHLACLNKDYVELLLKYGADPNMRNISGDSPLYKIAYFGKIECLKLCLEHGADPNIQGKNGATALHATSQYKTNKDCVQLLLDHHALILKDKSGQTPKDIARKENHHEIVDLIETYQIKRLQSGIQKLRALNLHYKLVSLWRDYLYERLDQKGYNRHQWFMVFQDVQSGYVTI